MGRIPLHQAAMASFRGRHGQRTWRDERDSLACAYIREEDGDAACAYRHMQAVEQAGLGKCAFYLNAGGRFLAAEHQGMPGDQLEGKPVHGRERVSVRTHQADRIAGARVHHA